MRFVSKSANLHVGNLRNATEAIRPPESIVVGGKTVTSTQDAYITSPSVPIAFSQSGLLQGDIDAALAHWKVFEGLPTEEDEVTPANPVENGRVGVWDSVEWQAEHSLSDDDREAGESLLLSNRAFGIEYILVEEVKAAKPWPSYDDTHHNKIVPLATELGLLNEALAYEQENKKRASVIEQLEVALPVETGEFISA